MEWDGPDWCLVWKIDPVTQEEIVADMTEDCIPWLIHFDWVVLGRDSDVYHIIDIDPGQSNPRRTLED
jgi:hypothetical protein